MIHGFSHAAIDAWKALVQTVAHRKNVVLSFEALLNACSVSDNPRTKLFGLAFSKFLADNRAGIITVTKLYNVALNTRKLTFIRYTTVLFFPFRYMLYIYMLYYFQGPSFTSSGRLHRA